MRSIVWTWTLLLLFAAAGRVLAEEETRTPRVLAPSWRDQASEAYEQKDWNEAIYLYRKWLEADPRDQDSWYNLACCYALAGAREKALEAFEIAVDAGWSDDVWPLNDPDLTTLRGEDRFHAAMKRAKAKGDTEAPEDFVRHYVTFPTLGTYIAMLPPGYEEDEASYPLVVILHGNGSTETRHGRLADALGREGVIYIAPRAPHPNASVFTNMRQPGWTWHPQDADEEATSALEPSKLYVDSVLAAVDDASRRYRVRGERFFVLGHSMGAFFANVTAALHPDRVRSVFAYAGGLPEAFQDPKWHAPLAEHGVRVFLAHGVVDPIVPFALSTQAHELLHAAGVDVTLYTIEDQDHGIGWPVRMRMGEWIRDVVRAPNGGSGSEAAPGGAAETGAPEDAPPPPGTGAGDDEPADETVDETVDEPADETVPAR